LEEFEPRVTQARHLMDKGRARLLALERAALEKLRSDVAKAIKARSLENKWSQESLFAAADKDSDGAISKADFASFIESCKMTLEPEQLDRFFASFEKDAEGAVAKTPFLNFSRILYRVVKETVLTTERTIRDSKTIRRLEVDETVEVIEGPIKDENIDIIRMRGTTLKDNLVGWVTVLGNNGAVILEEAPLEPLVAPEPTAPTPAPAPEVGAGEAES